ncbi:MAG: acyl-CoA dehydrogenase family protein [Mogibacterium sp.]|nr:acyl-CoA dehydrogenase family protein [Mogibacterium sp.]
MWWMNEERQMIAAAAREFAEQEVRPAAKLMEEEEKYPEAAIRKLGELGMLGLTIKEEYGGAGADYVNYGLMIEELAKESHGFGLLAYLASELTLGLIEKMGTPEQVKDLIAKGLTGEKIYGICFTEPCGVGNPMEYETRAVLDGDEWVINGGKIFITNADIADTFFVIAKTSDYNPATMTGLTFFVVPSDTPGLTVGHIENKLGWKGSHTGQLYFKDVRIPKDAIIGAVDNAWLPLNVALLPMFATYGPMNLGAMETIFQKTLVFLKSRVQCGVSLWDAHESIRIDMMKMFLKIDNYRSAVYSALEDENRGENISAKAVALKMQGADLLEEIASQCIELHGGTGTVYETGIERFYRDAKMGTVGCGSNRTLINSLASMIFQ